MSLAYKHIWLIGASTGIGEALALALAQKGAKLTLSARNADRLETLKDRLAGSGHVILPLDVTDLSGIETAWQSMDPPDMVIYNAGAYDPMGSRQFDYARAEAMLDVNFRGILRVLSVVLPAFIARNKGHIVLVGSVAGYRGLPNAIGYGASKAAVIHLAENLRADLSGSALKVQLVNPGFVKTRLTDKNSFKMPFIITAERAAEYIVAGMETSTFAIDFPKRFTLILKCLRVLPYSLYFRIVKKMA